MKQLVLSEASRNYPEGTIVRYLEATSRNFDKIETLLSAYGFSIKQTKAPSQFVGEVSFPSCQVPLRKGHFPAVVELPSGEFQVNVFFRDPEIVFGLRNFVERHDHVFP